MFLDVILRSRATKNLIVIVATEILRGVYPELAEGLRMTLGSFRMATGQSHFISRIPHEVIDLWSWIKNSRTEDSASCVLFYATFFLFQPIPQSSQDVS